MDTVRQNKILIIEDEDGMAQLLKERLESVGYEVHTEASGKSGLSYAVEYRPNLVILDLKLPDMGGYDVCRELRRLSSPWEIPVLMLTAMGQPIDQLRGFAHGADAYLTKPFEPTELLKTVALLLGQVAIT